MLRDPQVVALPALAAERPHGRAARRRLDDGRAAARRPPRPRHAQRRQHPRRDDGAVVLTELSRGSTSPHAGAGRGWTGCSSWPPPPRSSARNGRSPPPLGVLGKDGLAELLTFLEPAALSAPARRDLAEEKKLLKRCASRARSWPAWRPPTLVPLRRVSISNMLMAAGAILGVYLLIAQFSDVPNLGEIVRGAEKGWVVVVALLSQLPQFAGAFVDAGFGRHPAARTGRRWRCSSPTTSPGSSPARWAPRR